MAHIAQTGCQTRARGVYTIDLAAGQSPWTKYTLATPRILELTLEIKSEVMFERNAFAKRFPKVTQKTQSIFRREFAQYISIFRTKESFKRVAIGCLVMFFQQWSGIASIIYYAPIIFESLGLTSTTSSLLATGITGIINVVVTIPAILIIDRVGRRPLALASSTGMCICQIVVGVIVATCSGDWKAHAAAGWVAVVFVWLYIANFAYGWGPVSWTLIAEIFPLSKGTSISASAAATQTRKTSMNWQGSN